MCVCVCGVVCGGEIAFRPVRCCHLCWQLLNLVVRKERPDLADLGEQLVEQQNGFKIKMKELEDNILYKLATAEGLPT